MFVPGAARPSGRPLANCPGTSRRGHRPGAQMMTLHTCRTDRLHTTDATLGSPLPDRSPDASRLTVGPRDWESSGLVGAPSWARPRSARVDGVGDSVNTRSGPPPGAPPA